MPTLGFRAFVGNIRRRTHAAERLDWVWGTPRTRSLRSLAVLTWPAVSLDGLYRVMLPCWPNSIAPLMDTYLQGLFTLANDTDNGRAAQAAPRLTPG